MDIGSRWGSSWHNLSEVAREVLREQNFEGEAESHVDIWGKNIPAERVATAETPGWGVLDVP